MSAQNSHWEDDEDARAAERAAGRARREDYLQKLFGTAEPLDVHAPPAVADFDALLGEHAAQLRSAVRYTMGFAVSDNISLERHAQMIGSLTRLIQTNIAIAKVLGPNAKSKTVRGGEPDKDAQD